jgi:hypothetical protein
MYLNQNNGKIIAGITEGSIYRILWISMDLFGIIFGIPWKKFS